MSLGLGRARVISLNFNPLHRDFPAVAAAGKSFNVARIFSGFPQCLPKTFHGSVNAVFELNDRIVWPQPMADLFAQHNLAGALQQQGKNLKGLFSQANSLAPALAQLTRAKVEFHVVKADNGLGSLGLRHATPQRMQNSIISMEHCTASSVSPQHSSRE